MKLTNSTRRGTAYTSKALPEKWRQIPGVKYRSLPNELDGLLNGFIDERKWFIQPIPTTEFWVNAKPWQRAPFEPKEYDKSTFLTYETGLGKSWPAALLCEGRTLIVCPANHRETWGQMYHDYRCTERENNLVITKGSDWTSAPGCMLVTCTPQMVQKMSAAQMQLWDTVLLDESQAIKNSESKMCKALFKLRDANPDSIRILLSATPAANEPKDLWAQLDWLWPGRFGTQWQFLERYCDKTVSEYGTAYHGINEDHWPELQARFEAVTYRATKIEAVLGGHIPPLELEGVSIPRGASKVEELFWWTVNAVTRTDHVGLFFFHPETAKRFRQRLTTNPIQTHVYVTPVLSGTVTPKRRMLEIDRAKQAKRSISICTVEAMGEAIDLTHIREVAISEYSYKPSKTVQFLGRFQRLNCAEITKVWAFCQAGTEDEARVNAIATKLQAIAKCVREGASEAAVQTIMNINEDKIFAEAIAKMENSSGGLL